MARGFSNTVFVPIPRWQAFARCALILAVSSGVAAQAFAQSAVETPPATQDSRVAPPEAAGLRELIKGAFTDFRRLPTKDSVKLLTFGALFAAASQPYDASVTGRLAGAPGRTGAFEPGRILGGATFQLGTAIAAYSVGRLTHKPRVAAVAGHLLRAQIMSQAVTGAIKISARRMRPDASTRNSLPSGHTSVSFASATVLQREFGWKAGLPAYAVASYIGFSRVGEKRHYLSDVVFGAAIGIVAGRSVTVGRGDKRFLVTPVAARGGGGVSFVWTGDRR